MAVTRKVLSIDGGGIRGIVPAMILRHLEEEAGRPVSRMFDLVAGTSTGGILALGLVAPTGEGTPKYSADDLVGLYREEGPNIFSRSFWYWLRSLGNLVDAKYPAGGLERVLDRYFGSAMLSDSLAPVIVTSYEIERRIPWFFKSRKARDPELSEEYDFPMKTVARATAAAPTYFDPLRVDFNGGDNYYALVDGGVYANNPAMCAYTEARVMFPDDEILLVSVGTGKRTRRYPVEEVKDWGLTGWVSPILDVVFDGVADTIDFQLRQLLSADRYHRFQVGLQNASDAMDDTSPRNLRNLQLRTEELIDGERDRLERLAGILG